MALRWASKSLLSHAVSGSMLLALELFEAGDPRFAREIMLCTGRQLLPFCLRWSRDSRQFARQALLDLAVQPPDGGSARFIIKVLFKAAERAGDDELMAHFMVGFDLGVQRKCELREEWRWSERATRQYWVRAVVGHVEQDEFSLKTRAYLMRRAWRYFRRLGFRDPERYLVSIQRALLLYEDRHLPRPDSILDTMSLCRVLFRHSPALKLGAREMGLHTDLTQLEPAPAFAEVWRGRAGFEGLLELLRAARAAYVRGWARRMLEEQHQAHFASLTLADVRPLLQSEHDEAQRFAAARLSGLSGWGELGVDDWLELLGLDNPHAVEPLVALLDKHVAPERFTRAQCVELAKSSLAQVALLGLGWLKQRGLGSAAELAEASQLTEAQTAEVRTQALEWLKPELAKQHKSLLLRDWVDSQHAEVRRVALDVVRDVDHYREDLRLHAAMAESPYGEVFDVLVARLDHWRHSLPEADLRRVWATALLSVRRGSRTKQRALRLLADIIAKEPARADELLPLFAVLLRSARAPERRAALGALARAVFANPQLRLPVTQAISELSLWEESA